MTIPLFLTSLSLLDLDKHPDWPSITAQTFSAKEGQKTRMKCVEWALYRLFEIWDPELATNKLQPFFPPLEPLQSLNLRAALFRCLNELKKNGVLGRDTVLRKTMLDECKGERFEEVLAVFATVVVKKKLVHGEGSFVTHLATATSLSAEEQGVLLPLTVAHRASLANRLRTRDELRGRYEDFGGLLELKRRQLARREEELLLASAGHKNEPVISEDEAWALREKWRENWPGDEESLNALINGDVRHGSDALLNERCERVWEKVESGRLGEIEDVEDKSLLQELDGRVREQRRRLEKWKEFRQGFDKRAGEQKAKPATDGEAGRQTLFNLSFDAHKGLFPEVKSPLKQVPAAKVQAGTTQVDEGGPEYEYKRLMQAMEAELAKVGKSRRNGGTGWRRNKKDNFVKGYGLEAEEDEDMSRISMNAPGSTPQTERKPTKVAIEEAAPEPVEQSGDFSDIEPTHQNSSDKDERRIYEDELNASSSETSSGELAEIPAKKPNPPPPTHTLPESPQKPLRNTRLSLLGPEEQELLAEQIVSSVTNSEPSPAKPLPSLAERTRMSMAPRNTRISVLPKPEDEDTPEPSPINPAFDLMERTRKSMSVFQTAPQARQTKPKPRKSTAQQPKQSRRSTIYPPPPLPETPVKHQFGSTSSTPREELFSKEADYASVFKSRPKIALSPTFSPAGAGEDEDEIESPGPGLDESIVSGGWLDEEGRAERWESPSPMVMARERGRGGR